MAKQTLEEYHGEIVELMKKEEGYYASNTHKIDANLIKRFYHQGILPESTIYNLKNMMGINLFVQAGLGKT